MFSGEKDTRTPEARQTLSPKPCRLVPRSVTDFVWVTGHPSLDFCNTAPCGRELLAHEGDLGEWMTMARLTVSRPLVTDADLASARHIRDELRRALLSGDRIGAVKAVAEWLNGTPGRLMVDSSTLEWQFVPDGMSPCCLMVPVALDAIRIAREACDRVRECAGENCDVIYLDTSRNRSRRWCSMERCGARAKASAYYQRHRGGEGYLRA
jgi:predicted RNA-binding Zn ribbon-like protein